MLTAVRHFNCPNRPTPSDGFETNKPRPFRLDSIWRMMNRRSEKRFFVFLLQRSRGHAASHSLEACSLVAQQTMIRSLLVRLSKHLAVQRRQLSPMFVGIQ
ncbi:hypothetical protein Ae201684_013457 [Aphanomyces euteiches]|uniref:Uncharacterized protein n=1 Tax=Aphanomyces euteiches TaxID=100861 RepID=A0A6G0WNE8_9STRA|nr:hypothetical protein Ae201684_013457 [Aphanomyces euteiches]